MADTTPNEQSGQPEFNISEAKVLKTLLKDIAKDGGYYKDSLKESVKELDKVLKNYSKIGAKLSAINESAINIKDLEKEIKSTTEKRWENDKKLLSLSDNLKTSEKKQAESYLKNISDRAIAEAAFNQARIKDDFSLMESLNKAINRYDKVIAKKEDMMSIDQLEYAQAKKTQETYDETQKRLLTQKVIEKDIANQIGLSGGAVMKLAKNFGIGEQAAEAMVKKARDLNKEGKKISLADKFKVLKDVGKDAIKKTWEDPLGRAAIVGAGLGLAFKGIGKAGNLVGSTIGNAGKAMGGLNENSTGVVSNLTSGFSGMLKSLPLVGGLVGGIVDGLSGVADLLLGVNDQIIKAGRNLGLSRGEAEKMANHFQDVSFRNNDIYVTSKKLMDTQVSLGAQLGINNQLTDEQLSTLTKLKDIAGIDEQTQLSIAESSTITGKTAKETTQAVLAQVVGLQKATGISLNQKQILKEASSLGGYLGLSFAKYPGQLSKALVTAKSFGLELKQLDSIADSFLDFESSISNEFEAQLLTGKDINLTKAREAFLNNDLATAAGEISSQVGSSADFMKMNRIQAESLAKAMGMSRDQLGDMLKKQEILAKIGAKETDSSATQFELAKKKYATQKEFNAALGDEAFQNMQNASTQEKIAAYMDKLKTSIVDFVERSHLIDKIENFINYLSNPQNMQGVLNTIKGVIASAIEFFGGVASNVASLISHMPFTDTQKWQNIADKIDQGTNIAAESVRGVGGNTSMEGGSSITDRTARAMAKSGISYLPGNITKEANAVAAQNINFKIVQKQTKQGTLIYQILNEDGNQVLYDWQTGAFGSTN